MNAVLRCLVTAALATHWLSAPAQNPKRPSTQYLIAESKHRATCDGAIDFLNSLPGGDFRKPSLRGELGFLRWQDTRFVQSEVPGVSKSYWGAARLAVRLEGSDRDQTIFRLTSFDRYGQESDSLFLVPPNEKPPTDGAEFKEFLGERSHVYGNTLNHGYISHLRGMHGDRWGQWDMSGNIYIAAFVLSRNVYFLAATEPKQERILIFTLDAQGHQQQHCMLRRK
jgi:hypothetical protein